MEPNSAENIKENIVPISRFNRGQAGRIFEEVRTEGTKIVVKNGRPVCVLVAPERFEAMVQYLSDHFEAMAAGISDADRLETLRLLGIAREELDNAEVAIED